MHGLCEERTQDDLAHLAVAAGKKVAWVSGVEDVLSRMGAEDDSSAAETSAAPERTWLVCHQMAVAYQATGEY